jgi:hypothetical protein
MLKPLNRFNNLAEALALQAIPAGKIDIPVKYLVSGINRYEKLRLGAGLQTNTLFSKWLSVGAYAGYGLGDHAWKYGANLVLTADTRTHTEWRFSFSQDLQEPGTVPYFTENATLYPTACCEACLRPGWIACSNSGSCSIPNHALICN